MAERPIYGVVFNPKGVRWNFGDPLAAGDLPSDMKIGRRVAWGKFKLEAHYPNVNPGIDEAGLKHTEVKKGNYDTRKAAQDAFKATWKGVRWTAATKKAYIDRRVADGSFCRYYEDNSPYFLARTVWDSGVMPGVHLMTKTKDGRTVRFAVAASSKSKNSITLIGSMVVPLADDPDGGAILCSGPVATLTAKGDDNEFKVDKWDKHGIECPKTYKPEEGEPAVQIEDKVPPKYRYTKKELKESRKWKGLEWCPPDERLDYSYNQQAPNYKEAEGAADELCKWCDGEGYDSTAEEHPFEGPKDCSHCGGEGYVNRGAESFEAETKLCACCKDSPYCNTDAVAGDDWGRDGIFHCLDCGHAMWYDDMSKVDNDMNDGTGEVCQPCFDKMSDKDRKEHIGDRVMEDYHAESFEADEDCEHCHGEGWVRWGKKDDQIETCAACYPEGAESFAVEWDEDGYAEKQARYLHTLVVDAMRNGCWTKEESMEIMDEASGLGMTIVESYYFHDREAESFSAPKIKTWSLISCRGCSINFFYCDKCDDWFCEDCDENHETEYHAESFSAEDGDWITHDTASPSQREAHTASMEMWKEVLDDDPNDEEAQEQYAYWYEVVHEGRETPYNSDYDAESFGADFTPLGQDYWCSWCGDDEKASKPQNCINYHYHYEQDNPSCGNKMCVTCYNRHEGLCDSCYEGAERAESFSAERVCPCGCAMVGCVCSSSCKGECLGAETFEAKESLGMDITPRCDDIIPMYVEWIEDGTDAQREMAVGHITRMAKFVQAVLDADIQEEIEEMIEAKGIEFDAETFHAISSHRNRKGHFTGHQSVHNNDTGQFMRQGAETFEARYNNNGTVVLSDNDWRDTLHLDNNNYLHWIPAGSREGDSDVGVWVELLENRKYLKNNFTSFDIMKTHTQPEGEKVRIIQETLNMQRKGADTFNAPLRSANEMKGQANQRIESRYTKERVSEVADEMIEFISQGIDNASAQGRHSWRPNNEYALDEFVDENDDKQYIMAYNLMRKRLKDAGYHVSHAKRNWTNRQRIWNVKWNAETFEAPYGGAGGPEGQIAPDTFEARAWTGANKKKLGHADTAYLIIDNSGSSTPQGGGGLNTFKDAAKKTIDRLNKGVKKYVVIGMNGHYVGSRQEGHYIQQFTNKEAAKKHIDGMEAGGPTRPFRLLLEPLDVEGGDYTFVFTDAKLDGRQMMSAETFESQSAGDQIISWEEDGYSSASMPPSNVHFGAETR